MNNETTYDSVDRKNEKLTYEERLKEIAIRARHHVVDTSPKVGWELVQPEGLLP